MAYQYFLPSQDIVAQRPIEQPYVLSEDQSGSSQDNAILLSSDDDDFDDDDDDYDIDSEFPPPHKLPVGSHQSSRTLKDNTSLPPLQPLSALPTLRRDEDWPIPANIEPSARQCPASSITLKGSQSLMPQQAGQSAQGVKDPLQVGLDHMDGTWDVYPEPQRLWRVIYEEPRDTTLQAPGHLDVTTAAHLSHAICRQQGAWPGNL
ncbi:hypothetical protein VM1G_11442 [Cytospora mali]|uniref:Uncharacterized protein n=1 Tax=Cytospora mali TaxID=578113 RepID=A0A194VRI2_CYTMA|nr:hypothetical protein VM1G_11442 [Valsa mali]